MRKLLLALTIVAAVPTPVPAETTSLEFPIRAAFYYPWFPGAWNQKGIFPYTRFHPSLGTYSSSDPVVLGQHVNWMLQAKIEAGISSWFGIGHQTDSQVPALLQAAEGTPFRWTLYHEMEERGNPSVVAIDQDLDHIAAQYTGHPSFLRGRRTPGHLRLRG
jgi:glycosyl hydrolase family 99